jgi:hypothetical protein|tara:strand:+ start:349 stop:486 length:138 start_codon:yes stop_codon:yes gene_type:complete
MNSYHYSLDELDMMMPWEREVYLALLSEDVKRQKDEQQKQKMQRR